MRRAILILIAALTTMGIATEMADGIAESRRPAYEYTATEVDAAARQDLDRALTPYKLAGKLNRSAPEFERVHRLFAQVIEVAKRRSEITQSLDWEVYVHEGRFAEAYSRAGGKLVFSSGFLQRYRPTDAELAFVIGHEIAHALCEHERMNLSAVWRINAPQRLQARYAIEFLETEPLVRALVAPAARLQERVADRIGLELAAAAGIDSSDALEFFDKGGVDAQGGSVFPDLHDAALERKSMLLQTAAPLGPLIGLFRDRRINCSP
jgi:Zn-dependent protease with chaperone function